VTEVPFAGCWLPWPATFPPSEFLTLLTVYSSQCLASLFRLTSTHGVHPPKLSPSTQPVRLSAFRALLLLPPRLSPICSATFRALIRAKVRWPFVMFPSTKPPRCSPGLLLSRVFAFPAVASLSTGLLSPFGTSASTDRWSLSALAELFYLGPLPLWRNTGSSPKYCSSEFQRARKVACLSRELPTLLRSLNLSFPHHPKTTRNRFGPGQSR